MWISTVRLRAETSGQSRAAKTQARGYRSLRNLKAITDLVAGKLDLDLPT